MVRCIRVISWTLQNWTPGVNPYIWTTLMIVGIIVMVPGFPFVLYSRLHLVIRKPKDAEHSPHLYPSRRRRLPLTEAFYGLASDDPMKYVSLLLPADSSTSMGTSSRKLCLP